MEQYHIYDPENFDKEYDVDVVFTYINGAQNDDDTLTLQLTKDYLGPFTK